MFKRPSAFLPLAMSLTALAIVLLHVARFGTAREADEGTSAHIWQLLMVAQLPLIGVFAVNWLPTHPRQAALILTLQIAGMLAAAAPVLYLGF